MPKESKELSRIEILQKEQLVLAKERTILAFMQVGLASIGVGVIIVKFFDDMIFRAIGYLLVIVGGLEAYESTRRLRKKQKEMEELKKELRTS